MFVKELEFKTKFQGTEVRLVLLPLSTEDWLTIQGASDADTQTKRTIQLARGYVKNFEAQGIELDDVFQYGYYVNLASEIATALVVAAIPSDPSTPAVPSDGSRLANGSAQTSEGPSEGKVTSRGSTSGAIAIEAVPAVRNS